MTPGCDDAGFDTKIQKLAMLAHSIGEALGAWKRTLSFYHSDRAENVRRVRRFCMRFVSMYYDVVTGTCEASRFDSNSNRPSDSIRFERDWPIRKFLNRIGRACSLAGRKLSQTTQTINGA